MALAFDASSESLVAVTSRTWTHTPVGTPRGVFVGVVINSFTGTTVADSITSVTYGGVTMSLIGSVEDLGSGANGKALLYFLGTSIPTGAQSVVVTKSGTTEDTWGAAVTVTAGADTEGAGTIFGTAVNSSPSVTITGIAGASYGFGVIWSDLNAPTSITAGSGHTKRQDVDFGAESAAIESSTSENASGNLTIAFTAASNGGAFVGMAIQEISSGPANLKTYNTNAKANIKTINTNAIANVKTLNTNA